MSNLYKIKLILLVNEIDVNGSHPTCELYNKPDYIFMNWIIGLY